MTDRMFVIVHTDRHGVRRVDSTLIGGDRDQLRETAETLEARAHGYGRDRDTYRVYEIVEATDQP